MSARLKTSPERPANGHYSLRVEFLTDPAQLQPLEMRWEQLNCRLSDHDAPFFQSYAWIRHVARVRARQAPDRYRQLVATVTRSDKLIGIWPLALRRDAGIWTACSLDDPYGQFAGILFEDASDIMQGVGAILDELRSRADCLEIAAVTVGSSLHTALLAHGAKISASQQAVLIDLRPFPNFEEFTKSLNSKTRKNLRNLGNRLRRAGQVEHAVESDTPPLARILRDTYEARVKWLHLNGRTSPAFRDNDFRTMVNGLCQAEGLAMRGFSLTTGATALSSQWGFVYAGQYYAYMSAMNSDFEEFSPGRTHLGMVIESCHAHGVNVLELMPPAAGYKLEWGGRIKKLETLTMPFTFKGRMASHLTGWAVPTARRLSRALPEYLRKSLVGRLNRN